MNRPEGISPEAWEKALKCSFILSGDYEKHVNDIALAIQSSVEAERSRAALIAERFIGQTDYDLEPEAAVSESVTARSIADLIRKGA